MKLSSYRKQNISAQNGLVLFFWYIAGILFVQNLWVLHSGFKAWVLRLFGAQIGRGVILKPGIKIKYPWKLRIGNNSWIGEDVWIDNLEQVIIGGDVCISQGAYLCTGSHDWSKETFDLKLAPIHVQEGVWLAAKTILGPGITVGKGAVLTLGSVAVNSMEPMMIYSGNPAQAIKKRNGAA